MSLVVQQFLLALEDSDLEVRQIAAIIEKDPALLARIVGVANSAYFGYPEPVTTAEDAIFKVLGLNTAKNLALSIILSGPFDASRCPSFRMDRFWASALLSATLAQRLAPRVEKGMTPAAGDAYLGGLLHHLGLLALVHLHPSTMNELFLNHETPGQSFLCEEEIALFGMSHPQVGGWLARKWHLPENVVAVIEHHQEERFSGHHWPLVRLVSFATRWAASTVGDDADWEITELEPLGIAERHALRALEHLESRRKEIESLARILTLD